MTKKIILTRGKLIHRELLLGSLILFTGDMLFYYNGSQTDFISNMSTVSSERIIISGICALISTWLYTLASGQIYFAFQPAKIWIRLTVFLSFLAVMISFGIVHAAYIAIATSAKNAAELDITPSSLTELAVSANNALRYLAYIPFAIFSFLFATTVWANATYYPRWLILFNPVIPFLLTDLITNHFEGKIKAIIGGGYLNLILLLFFCCSTFALWLNKKKAPQGKAISGQLRCYKIFFENDLTTYYFKMHVSELSERV